MIFCVAVIVLELLIMLLMKIGRERDISHVDSLNDVIMVDDYYIGVGAELHQDTCKQPLLSESSDPVPCDL